MVAAFYVLLALIHLGVFDVLYFHIYQCRLDTRPESHREVLWHTIRYGLYGLQTLFVANFRFYGAALLILAAVYGFDIFIALIDIWQEPASRESQGGIPRGEYFMHIVMSMIVGGYMTLVFQAVWRDYALPTHIVLLPPAVPALLRTYMNVLSAGAFGAFFIDLYRWLTFNRRVTSQSLAQEQMVLCKEAA
jgi:hypothetical protein